MTNTTLPRELHFNPRTREGCDKDKQDLTIEQEISIHAPAKGATADTMAAAEGTLFQSTHPRRVRLCTYRRRRPGRSISIHAPAKGATARLLPLCCITLFQSTHPRRVRQSSRAQPRQTAIISIHAPAKGATLLRPHAEHHSSNNFNPRTREGCDRHRQAMVREVQISIHAPAKGATVSAVVGRANSGQISIHAPAKGATVVDEDKTPELDEFQSTHPRRVRHYGWSVCRVRDEFQSTHPRRVRPPRRC